MNTLKGYPRPDGRFGLRNNVICIATVMCATAVIEGISRKVPEVIPLIHSDGCETRRVRTLYFTKTLENICRHPNNYAVMLIGLGCERDNAKEIAGRLEKEGVRVWARVIQEDGGCQKVIEEGIKQAKFYLAAAKKEIPVDISLNKLVVGIETADHIRNEDPHIGCSDRTASSEQAKQLAIDTAKWLVDEGASVILPSIYGKDTELSDGTPIQTIKYADSVVADGRYYAIDQDGDRWKGPKDGVFNMDIPESLLSMCASGAQLLVLATSSSLPLGFPPAPLVKYSVECDGFMEADVCGAYSYAVFEQLKACILDVASGKQTYEEQHNEYGDLICTYRRTNIY